MVFTFDFKLPNWYGLIAKTLEMLGSIVKTLEMHGSIVKKLEMPGSVSDFARNARFAEPV